MRIPNELEEEATAVLNEEKEAPSPTAQYCAKRLRETRQQLTQAHQKISQLEAQLKELRENALRLQGQASTYAEDLMHWIQQANEEETKAVDE